MEFHHRGTEAQRHREKLFNHECTPMNTNLLAAKLDGISPQIRRRPKIPLTRMARIGANFQLTDSSFKFPLTLDRSFLTTDGTDFADKIFHR